jgi:hypothetical protein
MSRIVRYGVPDDLYRVELFGCKVPDARYNCRIVRYSARNRRCNLPDHQVQRPE